MKRARTHSKGQLHFIHWSDYPYDVRRTILNQIRRLPHEVCRVRLVCREWRQLSDELGLVEQSKPKFLDFFTHYKYVWKRTSPESINDWFRKHTHDDRITFGGHLFFNKPPFLVHLIIFYLLLLAPHYRIICVPSKFWFYCSQRYRFFRILLRFFSRWIAPRRGRGKVWKCW